MKGLELPPNPAPPTKAELETAFAVLSFLVVYHTDNGVKWHVVMAARELVSAARFGKS